MTYKDKGTYQSSPPCIACATRATFKPNTATHCNTLQHTATHCNTLQPSTAHSNALLHKHNVMKKGQLEQLSSKTLQRAATHCDTLQHVATHAQHDAKCSTRATFKPKKRNTLQHTATLCKYCNTQTTSCNMSYFRAKHPATHCNTESTHCNTLQHKTRKNDTIYALFESIRIMYVYYLEVSCTNP